MVKIRQAHAGEQENAAGPEGSVYHLRVRSSADFTAVKADEWSCAVPEGAIQVA